MTMQDSVAAAVVIILVWAVSFGLTLMFMGSGGWKKDDDRPLLHSLFPNSPRARKIVGRTALALAPLSLGIILTFVLCLGVWRVLDGTFFRWITKVTGM